MRVLILSNMYPSAEKPYAGIFVRNQVEIMQQQFGDDWSVTVRAMPRKFTGPVGSFIKYLIFALRCLPLLFRKFDIVHVHYFIPLVVVGSIYRRLHPRSRLFVTFHGGDVNPRHFRGIRIRTWRRISRAVDCGIAVGPGTESIVREYLECRRVILLPAGIDSRRFYCPDEPLAPKYDFVFAGSFSERKGVDLLIEALQDEALADTSIVFIGTGPLRDSILDFAADRQVDILDHLTQNEMRQVFWSSKFIVLPSRSEPFGLVVSEAMFCGVPALVSDEPGLLSQVDAGHNGLVFENESVEQLRQRLIEAKSLGDADYQVMAGHARESNKRYDIYEVGNSLASEYQKELGNQG